MEKDKKVELTDNEDILENTHECACKSESNKKSKCGSHKHEGHKHGNHEESENETLELKNRIETLENELGKLSTGPPSSWS